MSLLEEKQQENQTMSCGLGGKIRGDFGSRRERAQEREKGQPSDGWARIEGGQGTPRGDGCPQTHSARGGKSRAAQREEETKEIRKKEEREKKTTMVKSSAHEDEQTEPGEEEKE